MRLKFMIRLYWLFVQYQVWILIYIDDETALSRMLNASTVYNSAKQSVKAATMVC